MSSDSQKQKSQFYKKVHKPKEFFKGLRENLHALDTLLETSISSKDPSSPSPLSKTYKQLKS